MNNRDRRADEQQRELQRRADEQQKEQRRWAQEMERDLRLPLQEGVQELRNMGKQYLQSLTLIQGMAAKVSQGFLFLLLRCCPTTYPLTNQLFSLQGTLPRCPRWPL